LQFPGFQLCNKHSAKINGILAKADKEFNKPYWQEKNAPRTSLKAENPKASSLRIILQAIPIASKNGF